MEALKSMFLHSSSTIVSYVFLAVFQANTQQCFGEADEWLLGWRGIHSNVADSSGHAAFLVSAVLLIGREQTFWLRCNLNLFTGVLVEAGLSDIHLNKMILLGT